METTPSYPSLPPHHPPPSPGIEQKKKKKVFVEELSKTRRLV